MRSSRDVTRRRFIRTDGVEAAPLNALEAARTDTGIRINLGNLVSGQDVAVVVALKFPPARVGVELPARIVVADRDGVLGAAVQTFNWTVASDPINDAQPRDLVVDRAGRLQRPTRIDEPSFERPVTRRRGITRVRPGLTGTESRTARARGLSATTRDESMWQKGQSTVGPRFRGADGG